MLLEAVGFLASFAIVYFVYTSQKMAKQGSFFFKIGYSLYSRTSLGHVYHRRDVTKALRKYPDGHSVVKTSVYGDLKITPIPMVDDNYSYLIEDVGSQTAVLVDPSVPETVQPVLDAGGVTPVAVLTTHKHWDHSGGNHKFKKRYRNIQVYGGLHDNVPAATNTVSDGDNLQFGNLNFTVFFTPGHTVGHVTYLLKGSPFGVSDSLFTGDLLFVGGIGRMFECDPSVMLQSLDRIMTLSDDSFIWPGHEYAQDNLEFAASLDSKNQVVQEKFNWVTDKRKARLSTIPSRLGEEKQFNPFLRTHHQDILNAVGLNEEKMDSQEDILNTRARALALIRERKDKFKYKL